MYHTTLHGDSLRKGISSSYKGMSYSWTREQGFETHLSTKSSFTLRHITLSESFFEILENIIEVHLVISHYSKGLVKIPFK